METASERFFCTHCEHHFECAPQENLICPNCFWSTSVVRDESAVPPKKRQAPVSEPTPSANLPALPRWVWTSVFLLAIFLGISFFAWRYLQKQNLLIQNIKIKNAEVIATQAPEFNLSPEEKEILNRDLSILPADQEKEILKRRIPLRSRMIQGLATPPWATLQFDEFLKTQEAQYRMPLERSYRRKLRALFKLHYLAATAAFEAKEYLKARDEWIRSLAFPVYHNDVARHRGVVLTLLRPYINDILAKIGTLNALLTEKDLFETEEKIRSSYEALLGLLQQESWEEAQAQILELEKLLEVIAPLQGQSPAWPLPVRQAGAGRRSSKRNIMDGIAPFRGQSRSSKRNIMDGIGKTEKAALPPPFPEELGLVDSSIQEVVLAQANPPEPGERDWMVLWNDLQAKEQSVKHQLPGALDGVREKYRAALVYLQNASWSEAKELLQQIEFPPALEKDAKEKIQILEKLQPRLQPKIAA